MIRTGMIALALAATLLAGCVSQAPAPKERRFAISQDSPPDAFVTSTSVESSGPFAKWTAVVVAADDQAAGGGRTEAFDNARRDLTDALVKAGFDRGNIAQFSASGTDGDAYTEPTPQGLKAVLGRTLARAGEGCLIYLTSHGNQTGIVLDNGMLKPQDFAAILGGTCALRPTIAVVSACYSGVFLEPLEAPNRLVLTAARPDRNSFGCGEGDKYPYFDACMLEEIGGASDFVDLSKKVQGCVARKEQAGKLKPSEPQLSVGSSVSGLLVAKGLGTAAP